MSRALTLYRAGNFVAGCVPLPVLVRATDLVARLVMTAKPSLADGLRRNLERVLPGQVDDALVRDSFASYGRYWVETFRVPAMSAIELDRGFSFVGVEHLEDARSSGVGPIIVLPHLGGWEWAAAWLGRVADRNVTAVVERLDPADLFEWFVEHRASYNVNVVPLGGTAMAELTRAVRERDVLCLMSDRDIAGNGVEVEFFGEVTRLPIGPAILSVRTGAPLLPTAVMFRNHDRVCYLGAPLFADQDGTLRERATGLTQRFACEFEALIRRAPEQWHVLSPLWPDVVPA